MIRPSANPFCIGTVVLLGVLLMGQDSAAQTDPCDPDPCPGITNAVPDTCTPVGGSCTPADDFTCNCDTGFTWQDATNTCRSGSSPTGLVPDTGIEECYNNTLGIECPAPGQPFYGQDAQYVNHPMSYTLSPDGLTVTDNVTRLIWQRCSAGLSGANCSVGAAESRTWANAITCCEGLDLAGHTDWRLPTVYDLQGIVHCGRYEPSIDTTAFPGANSYRYWSSSTTAHFTGNAWGVHFVRGEIWDYGKTGPNYVRCVRGESIARSFTDHLDGTVTDNATGLVWQQEDDNQLRNWEASLAYCEALDLGGHMDWRLPDVKELRSLVDNTQYNPSIDTALFPGTNSNYYWSSSTGADYTYYAGYVAFAYGHVGHDLKTDTAYVRCVR